MLYFSAFITASFQKSPGNNVPRTILKNLRPLLNALNIYQLQGVQYTSKAFIEYCDNHGVTQSMSKAGYPYDNTPMERYFNTLKNEEIYLHQYHTEEQLYEAVEQFAYVKYNHVRPHSYNGYRTPFEARYAA